jgi:hypothetical protein
MWALWTSLLDLKSTTELFCGEGWCSGGGWALCEKTEWVVLGFGLFVWDS